MEATTCLCRIVGALSDMFDMLETGVLHSPLIRIQHEPRWLHNIEIIIYIIIFIYISIFIDISRSGRSGLFKVRLGSHRSKTRSVQVRFPPPPSFVAVVSDRVRGSPQPKTSNEVGTPRAGYSSSKSSSNNVSNDSNDTRDTYYRDIANAMFSPISPKL